MRYQIWANLVDLAFKKAVYYYQIKITCVDEDKAEFTINVQKDFNLRKKILQHLDVYAKLNEMFNGRYVYNDTLVKVIEIAPDKAFQLVYKHEEDNINLEATIQLQGEKTEKKAIISYTRDILKIYQKHIMKYKSYGKMVGFYDPGSAEPIQGEIISIVKGVDLNINLYKGNVMKINIDYKVATIFTENVADALKKHFRNEEFSYDELMQILMNRKFTDQDTKLYIDDIEPKKERYGKLELEKISAKMYASLRNKRFKRDPQLFNLKNIYYMPDNKDIHGSEEVKMAIKRKQLKDFQFFDFCNNALKNIKSHWLFAENGIIFENNFNIIPIFKTLSCKLMLGNNSILTTHDEYDNYDQKYNDIYKGISSNVLNKGLSSQNNILQHWTIVIESAQGTIAKIEDMVGKMQKSLASIYGIKIEAPNKIVVNDLSEFDFKSIGSNNQFIMFILNSRYKNALTKKYEYIKYKCNYNNNEPKVVPNQIVLSKTVDKPDFQKMVVLNLMYDMVMKIPNTYGHRIMFDDSMLKWLDNSTMIFAYDVCHRKGHKSVAALLSYLDPEFTTFRSEYLIKDEENSEIKYTDNCKEQYKEAVKTCIKDWEYHNKRSVKRLIFYRDSVNDCQRRNVENTEIAYINEVFAEQNKEDVQLIFLTASKRISTKIFDWNSRDNKLGHLEAGVYVHKDICKDFGTSFYLNASNNRLSKCCFYECLYPKEMDENCLENLMALTFKLSFMYFHGYNIANCSVPGILKYAEKKANLFSVIESLKIDEINGKELLDKNRGSRDGNRGEFRGNRDRGDGGRGRGRGDYGYHQNDYLKRSRDNY